MLSKLVPLLVLFGICNAELVINLYRGDIKQKAGDNVTVAEGDSFQLVCSNIGNENSIVTWSKVKTDKKQSDNVVLRVPVNTKDPSILIFKSVLLKDEGRYWCSDKVDEELTSVYIFVKAATTNNFGSRRRVKGKFSFASYNNGAEVNNPEYEDQPELVIMQQTNTGQEVASSVITANEGDKITLTCALKYANGTVDYDVDWVKLQHRQRIEQARKMYLKKPVNGIEPPKLVLSAISYDDVGRYLCTKADTKLYQSVLIKVKPTETTTTLFSRSVFAAPICQPTAMNEEHRKIMEELREGLQAISALTHELLNRFPSPPSISAA